MMTLNDIKLAIQALSPDEVEELFAYVQFRRKHPVPPDERIRRMQETATFIRESLTSEEFEQAIEAMNAEYTEPWDEDEWTT